MFRWLHYGLTRFLHGILIGKNPILSHGFNPFQSDPKQYEYELTVSDPYSSFDKDSVIITILAEENLPPVASSPHFEINIFHDGDPNTFDSEPFTLDGSDSYDLDGDNFLDNEDGIINIYNDDYITIQSYISFKVNPSGF
mgnify:CR=1 FL=1